MMTAGHIQAQEDRLMATPNPTPPYQKAPAPVAAAAAAVKPEPEPAAAVVPPPETPKTDVVSHGLQLGIIPMGNPCCSCELLTRVQSSTGRVEEEDARCAFGRPAKWCAPHRMDCPPTRWP